MWVTPLAAAFLAVMLLISIGFHLNCRETPKVWVLLILFVLSGFVAYGRWYLAPL